MRILRSIVLPSTALMTAVDTKIAGGGPIRAQVVGDRPIGDKAVFLQKFAHQFQRGMLVSFGLDQHIEDLALGGADLLRRRRLGAKASLLPEGQARPRDWIATAKHPVTKRLYTE